MSATTPEIGCAAPRAATATHENEFVRPFPALTPAQRYHFEVFGYVVIPGVFARAACERMYDALKRLRHDLRAAAPADPMKASLRGNARFLVHRPHHVAVVSMYEYDESLRDYPCHPRVVGLGEEIMGCEARITELVGHVNAREPDADLAAAPQFAFHRGADVPFGSHTVNGLYHCNFVKCLTNLTNLGPDDGGTVVIAGSHRMLEAEPAIQAAYADRTLIHQVVAPAGSTLLFAETLIHATGQIRSDRERAIVIAGYGPRLYPMWDGTQLTPEFAARIPESLKTLFLGKAHWRPGARYRQLGDPVDSREMRPVQW